LLVRFADQCVCTVGELTYLATGELVELMRPDTEPLEERQPIGIG
jgi:hypothetical protein